MNKLLPKTTLFLFLFITAIAILWLPIQADEPTAVHLASFDLVPLNNAVRIDWETATELGTAGFRIKRAATPGGNGEFLDYVGDNGFVPAAGDVTFGSSYTATDNQVQNGEVYTYILVEIENSGTETELARETVTVGIRPTNTPGVISGGIGGSAATATPTSTKSATSVASATPSANSKGTTPTSTRPSFVTITPKSVQPTPVPTQNSNTATANQASTNNTNSESDSETNNQKDSTDSTIIGVTEVLAQEDSTETEEIAVKTDLNLTQQTQDDYPGGTTTAVPLSDGMNPNNDPVSTPIPVIGSNQGYTGAEPTNTTSSGGMASTNQGQVFLWLGFIVALLIFITGLIGSIILFTRRLQ